MPTWRWWVVAFLMIVLWNTSSMQNGYWFGGWWKTLLYRPLGEWHAVDFVPPVFTYALIRIVIGFVALVRELEAEERARKESSPQVK